MSRTIVSRGKNFIVYSDGTIRVDNVRMSYPHLAKAWAKNETDRKKYSATGLAPKETHDEAKKALVEAINKLLTASKMGKIGSEHKFVRDGDDTGKAENEGMWVIKASENEGRAPSVRYPNGSLIPHDKIESIVYPGCIVNILIRPWAQNNVHGKKINANLIGVQFVRDGERLGEAPIDDEGAWDEIEDETGGDSGDDGDDL